MESAGGIKDEPSESFLLLIADWEVLWTTSRSVKSTHYYARADKLVTLHADDIGMGGDSPRKLTRDGPRRNAVVSTYLRNLMRLSGWRASSSFFDAV